MTRAFSDELRDAKAGIRVWIKDLEKQEKAQIALHKRVIASIKEELAFARKKLKEAGGK